MSEGTAETQIEDDISALVALDEIPEEAFAKLVDDYQDYMDQNFSTRTEISTLLEFPDEDEPDEEKLNKRKRKHTLGTEIPDEIGGLMNRAYQEFYQQHDELAMKLASNARKICPKAPEPYALLASISAAKETYDTALAFAEKAAELANDPFELWIECAQYAEKLQQTKDQAVYLKKAAESKPDEIECLLEMRQLLENSVEDKKLTKYCLKTLAERLPTNPEHTREYAEYLNDSGKMLDAMEVLKNYFDASAEAGIPPDLQNANYLASCYLNENMNEEVLQLDEKLCELVVDPPPDLRVNAAIAYIKLRRNVEAEPCLATLKKCDPKVYTEVFDLVGDAYTSAGFYYEAAKWYQIMQDGGIEKRYEIADCLMNSAMTDDAIEVLQQLITDCPAHSDAVGLFFYLMKKVGREEEAVAWLDANAPSAARTDDIVLKRAESAFVTNDYDSFVDLAAPLVCRCLYDLYALKLLQKESKSIEQVLNFTTPDKMSSFMKSVLRYRRINPSSNVLALPDSDFFLLCKALLKVTYDRSQNDISLALGSLLMMARERIKDRDVEYFVLFYFSLSAFRGGESGQACSVMRAILLENNDNVVWEYFNIFIQKTPDQELNAHKFLIRALKKLPDCAPLQILLGNHSHSTVWFDHAISQYLSVLRTDSDEPIVSLLLTAAYLSKAYVRTQKTTRKSVLCAFACLRKYADIRGDFPVEVDYNMGRFYQTVKMAPQAEKFYRRVLEAPIDYAAIAEDPDAHEARYSLQRDAAFNLALLYKESNPNEARRLMRRYLTV